MNKENEEPSTLDIHVRGKQRELQANLSNLEAADQKLRRSLDGAMSDGAARPEVDALYVQLALLDLPKAAATGLMKSEDELLRGPAQDMLDGLKVAGRRLFHAYSEALHSFICEKAGGDLRGRVLSAISSGGSTGALTAAFIAIGTPAPIAPIAAALLDTLLVKPTVGEVCAMWSASLSKDTGA